MFTRSALAALALAVALAGCDTRSQKTPSEEAAGAADAAGTDIKGAAERIIAEGAPHGPLAFGAEITPAAAVPIGALDTEPGAHAGRVVTVEGTVSAVCKASGCWVEVMAEDGSTITASSLEHDVLLPTNCEGRPITVQGRYIANEPTTAGGEPTYTLSMDAVVIRAGDSS